MWHVHPYAIIGWVLRWALSDLFGNVVDHRHEIDLTSTGAWPEQMDEEVNEDNDQGHVQDRYPKLGAMRVKVEFVLVCIIPCTQRTGMPPGSSEFGACFPSLRRRGNCRVVSREQSCTQDSLCHLCDTDIGHNCI